MTSDTNLLYRVVLAGAMHCCCHSDGYPLKGVVEAFNYFTAGAIFGDRKHVDVFQDLRRFDGALEGKDDAPVSKIYPYDSLADLLLILDNLDKVEPWRWWYRSAAFDADPAVPIRQNCIVCAACSSCISQKCLR